MINIISKPLEFEIELKKKIEFICDFCNTKPKIINENADTWKKLVYENSDLRVINQGCVKSVDLSYYGCYILDTLQSLGKVKMSKLVGTLMTNVYLIDIMYVYLIERLIKCKKIKITLNSGANYFQSFIEINN